jgi:hypothetical protein
MTRWVGYGQARTERQTLAKIEIDNWIALARAAEQLGENAETTRLRIGRRELKGEKRGRAGRWFIEPQSLARLVAARGGSRTADARFDLLESRVDSLTTAVQELIARIQTLPSAPADRTLEMGMLSRQRDRFRAEASTFREAAMRANASQRSMAAAFRLVLDALDENADALTEMLGPRDLDDLLRQGLSSEEHHDADDLVNDAEAFWGGSLPPYSDLPWGPRRPAES